MNVKVVGPLPISTRLSLGEQDFVLVRRKDFQRQDGGASKLSVWSSKCRTCGMPYEVETAGFSRLPNRRCRECIDRDGTAPIKGSRKQLEVIIDLTGTNDGLE